MIRADVLIPKSVGFFGGEQERAPRVTAELDLAITVWMTMP
jgi:hypothetical protein